MKQPAPVYSSANELIEQDNNFIPCHLTNEIYITQDYPIGREFLLAYKNNPETFNTYRKELERFVQWCWHIREISFIDIKRKDMEQYLEFVQAPPASWISKMHQVRFHKNATGTTPNPEWRPFSRHGQESSYFQLSSKAMQVIISVLSTFYNFLIQEEITELNPITQIKQKSKYIRKEQTKVIRRLSNIQWRYVINVALELADSEPNKHERTLFIMQALFGMYLRISELTANNRWTPMMKDFFRDQDANWWFRTVGKGNKERVISVSNAMLDALTRYRNHLNLSSLPNPKEQIPLLSKLKGNGALNSTRQIRSIVQKCFEIAIIKLREKNLIEEAEQLSAATVHWLRHTGISEDVKTRPREHVRDDAGHSSGSITDQYIDVELKARHQSARKKKILQNE